MSRFWSPVVQTLSPYVPGEQPRITNLVKLNTNENPFPPSPRACRRSGRGGEQPAALSRSRASGCARRSPPITASSPSEVFVGNGSDEVLAHAFQRFFKQPTRRCCSRTSPTASTPSTRALRHRLRDCAAGRRHAHPRRDYRRDGGLIVIANPNAPTCVALPRARSKRCSTIIPTRWWWSTRPMSILAARARCR